MKKKARVVVVGRMNVGKSTLFNRLSEGVKSLTLDYDGVTRDIIKDTISWDGRTFELIDTGGVSLRKTNDVILETVRKKALEAVETADVILFVVDAKVGVLQEDHEISKFLHTLGKPVIVLVNKIDSGLAHEHLYEFERLGHSSIIHVSAHHGTGIGDILEKVVKALPQGEPDDNREQDSSCNVVLLGKPNVGKSSLMNHLLKQERSIVTDQPGTTREAVSEKISFYKEDIKLTDTAGVRRKRVVDEELEEMMVKSSFRALREADIVLLLIDASAGRLADQELKLAFYALENHKALILLFNKQDLVTEEIKEQLKFNLEPYKHLMKRVERLDISCKTGKNVGKLLAKIQELNKRHSQRFSDDELSMLFKDALLKRPLFHKTNPLRILRVRQTAIKPITLLLIVNQPEWFEKSQLTFFENQLRRVADLRGVPIKFVVRKKHKGTSWKTALEE